MNYKVLYRKYRPSGFDSLVGQNHVVEILKNSIKENKIAHAYIFSGPRGTGKTSTARILAKAINCLNNTEGKACEKCANCQSFSTTPDIIEIDAASNNGVDEIRELINNVKIMPTSLKYKVYIIDEVHMLSQSAFNALLLTLEEPPEHVIFILATTNLESVPITILSRCQKFDFKRISTSDIVERLKYICEEEHITYTDEAIKEIAVLSDGGLRDALSILDQLSKNGKEITIDLISSEVGTISNQKIDMLITAIDNNKIEKIEEIFQEFRDINLNYKVVIKKLIDEISKYAIDNLKNGIKNHLTYDQYKNMIIELNDVLNKINVSIDPYILIEVILMNYVDKNKEEVENQQTNTKAEESKKNDQIIEKKVEQKLEIKEKNTTINNDLINIRINNCFANANKEILNNLKERWTDFSILSTSAKIKGLIADTMPVTASENYAILVTTIKHKDKELNKELSNIENDFNFIFKKNYRFIFIDEAKWKEEKQKYIDNLKQGIKYKLIPEELVDIQEEKPANNGDIESIANDIFGIDKIEIE